jgi:hypothetical protein
MLLVWLDLQQLNYLLKHSARQELLKAMLPVLEPITQYSMELTGH